MAKDDKGHTSGVVAPPIVAIQFGVNYLTLYGARLVPGQVYASSYSFAPGEVGQEGPITVTGDTEEQTADSAGNLQLKVPLSVFPSGVKGKVTWWLHLPGSDAIVASSVKYIG